MKLLLINLLKNIFCAKMFKISSKKFKIIS